MSILLNAHLISKSFSDKNLFKDLSFSVSKGDRIGLIGPNGAGKSTLLKILASKETVDSGTLSIQKGLKVGFLQQVPSFEENINVMDAVLEKAHDKYDWEEIAKAQEWISRLELTEKNNIDPETLVSSLSGGWKKRVALARELMTSPDLLLLDEPTNHLDVESIMWLEDFLSSSPMAVITITHDRLFLQRISNRIIEIDRRHPGGMINIQGDYAHYLTVREQLLSAQELKETKLKNTLRRETEWLARGPIARLKKQQARINQAHQLAEEVDEISSRNLNKKIDLDFKGLEKNPKKLIELKNVEKSYGGEVIIPNLNLIFTPQTRLGLIGPNGCGKSTLIKLIVGTEVPDKGHVQHSDRLEFSYFEQNRESLDFNLTPIQTLAPSNDHVSYAGQMIHVRSYLNRFLFSFQQMDMPVGKMSGGEQSRLLLARLMLKPANVLILDEPTNDLDIATLDILQDILTDFNGAIVLVSHDRYFMDNVCNQLLAFGYDSGGTKILEPLVGITQWELWNLEQQKIKESFAKNKISLRSSALNPDTSVSSDAEKSSTQNKKDENVLGSAEASPSKTKKKLSFKDQRDLDMMEENIAKAEEKLQKLTEMSMQPEVATSPQKLLEVSQQMAEAQSEIDKLYKRWEELS